MDLMDIQYDCPATSVLLETISTEWLQLHGENSYFYVTLDWYIDNFDKYGKCFSINYAWLSVLERIQLLYLIIFRKSLEKKSNIIVMQ